MKKRLKGLIRKKIIKNISIISMIILVGVIILLIVSTRFVDHTPYFESDYYKNSYLRIESLRNTSVTVKSPFQAGFAKVSITPELHSPEDNYLKGKFKDIPLAGYGARKGKPATGIHDSIFVYAAALKAGGQTIVLITADLLLMPPVIVDSVVTLLSGQGVKREQLFFSATHTHSSPGGWGPGYIGKQFAGEENKNLQKWLTLQISDAVVTAINDLRPAQIGSGSFDAGEYTKNRFIGESGTKNDDFSFIIIEQTDHKKAILGSFSAHSTTLGSDIMKISGDYPGYWSRKMENEEFDFALFFAGAMGSQSPTGKGRDFERSEFLGEALADSLILKLPEVTLEEKPEFSHISLLMELPDYGTRITDRLTLSSFANNMLMPAPSNPYLQAIRIGNTVWITTPADFSGEYAFQIKNYLAAKGFDSNVTSFNGNSVGYIVPSKYYYLDEYESKLMGWFGPNMGEYTLDLIRHISDIVIYPVQEK